MPCLAKDPKHCWCRRTEHPRWVREWHEEKWNRLLSGRGYADLRLEDMPSYPRLPQARPALAGAPRAGEPCCGDDAPAARAPPPVGRPMPTTNMAEDGSGGPPRHEVEDPAWWAVGLTTVASRRDDLLPRTLRSLAAAGFEGPAAPWLFADGVRPDEAAAWQARFGDRIAGLTTRWPAVKCAGNWVLSLCELYYRCRRWDAVPGPRGGVVRLRMPARYVVFQDDLELVRNLRPYLERLPVPDDAYLNLFTYPSNQHLCPPGHRGFYPSNQFGRGALALVFSRRVVTALLGSPPLTQRVLGSANDPHRGDHSIDGGIVTALAAEGVREWVHNPSLVQHAGHVSTVSVGSNPKRRLAVSFPGDDYNALDLLK